MKVMVSIPDDFLAEIDRVAQEEKRSRSELLREAMRLYLDTRAARRRLRDDPHVQQAIAVQDRLARLHLGAGEDSTEDIRHWREARR